LSEREEWSVVCLCGGNLNNNGECESKALDSAMCDVVVVFLTTLGNFNYWGK